MPGPARAVEVLAHYSATTAADLHYKAQARAYLAFKPVRSLPCPLQQIDLAREVPDVNDQDEAGTALFLDETQAAILALRSQISPSLKSNDESIQLASFPAEVNETPVQRCPVVRGQQFTNERNDSSIAHSSHLQTPIFHRQAKRRRLLSPQVEQAFIASSLQQHNLPSVSAIDHPQQSEKQPGVSSSSQPQPLKSSADTSELPTSYSLSDIVLSPTFIPPSSVQRSISDPGPLITRTHTHGQDIAVQAMIEPLLDDPHTGDKMVRDAGIYHTVQLGGEAMVTAEIPNATSIRLIIAPPPRPRLGKFTTHVTDALKLLEDSPKLRDVYRPTAPTRPLQILERGHWCFSISSWPKSLQDSFWAFLEAFVTGGAAGWGIYCCWNPLEGGKNVIEAFCWGEIVEHTYLLLHVASGGKIKTSAARWVDSSGKVILTAAGIQ